MKKYQLLNSFWLKIIAIVTMTIDHIGAIIFFTYSINSPGSWQAELYEPTRIIGRISFIIIAYLIVDGCYYTRNFLKYLTRLLILALSITLGELIFLKSYSGNPITTLFLGALTIYLLNLKKQYKPLAIIPPIYVILSDLEIIPMKAMYGIYGYFLIIGFYFAFIFARKYMQFICEKNGLDQETFITNYSITNTRNLISIAFLFSYNLIWYFIFPVYNGVPLMNMTIQVYSIFSAFFILLYNGERGYNKKWFKYSCYLYFPLHLIIIYLISLI